MQLETYMNTLYGHARILREYAHTFLPYALPGELQHGWTTHFLPGVDLSQSTLLEKQKIHLVFNERNHLQALSHNYCSIPIGSPILYMKPPSTWETIKHISIPEHSLLLMPSHSIPEHSFLTPCDRFHMYLEDIQPLLETHRFHPITVCLYWHDYQTPGVRTIFESTGLQTVSTPHREDPLFLYKLRHLMFQHRYASSNQLATSIFYALYWQRIAFTLGRWTTVPEINCLPYHSTMNTPISTVEEQTNSFQSAMYPELRWHNFDNQAHPEIGNYEVGLQYKQTPTDLRALLNWTPRNWPGIPRKEAAGRFLSHLLSRYLPYAIKQPLKRLLTSNSGYLDPGTGSIVYQVIIGSAVGLLVGLKLSWSHLKSFFSQLISKITNRKKVQ